MRHLVVLAFISSLLLSAANAFQCFCDTAPCEVPSCCPSGAYTADPCGCCPACAKVEGDECGGPWRTTGVCNVGLACLKSCSCRTNDIDNPKDCIFPFTYNGKEYTNCTIDDSESGNPWCATEVNEDGEMVENQKGECEEGCPGTEYECHNAFQETGKCITDEEKNDYTSRLTYEFDDGITQDYATEAPVCSADSEDDSANMCKCSDDQGKGILVPGDQEAKVGGCLSEPLNSLPPTAPGALGWCFLNYVNDPAEPTKNCFTDVTWSETAGRFWSNEACMQTLTDVRVPPTIE